MKKLSLLIALCMLISIGGVYAVWTYSEAPVPEATGTISSMRLSGLGTMTEKGTFTVVTTGTDISIDQDGSDYSAKLVCAGTIQIKFTPSLAWRNANPTQNTFYVDWHLSAANKNFEVDTDADNVADKKLFETFNEELVENLPLTWSDSEGAFVGTISNDVWGAKMTLNTFYLTTKAAYDKCSVSGFGSITVHVHEHGVNSDHT